MIATTPISPAPERYLTISELADFLTCSERFLQLRAREGMPYLPVGRARRYRASDVASWLQQRYAQEVQ